MPNLSRNIQLTSGFDTDLAITWKSLTLALWHTDLQVQVGYTPKCQNFLSDNLQLMHVIYETSINMQQSFIKSFQVRISSRLISRLTERFWDNGQIPEPLINIFDSDARVSSEDHRSITRAWPTARAPSYSKAWLHRHTHRCLVLFRLVYGVFSLSKKTAFASF